jgi:3-oxoadipate enol-lactonase
MTLLLLTPIGLDPACWGTSPHTSEDEIRHTFPGFGQRPRWEGDPTIERWADDAVDGLDGPLDIVGVSLGGMVGQHIALRHPERVRSLLLACTGAQSDVAAMAQRIRTLEADGVGPTIEPTLSRWFTRAALAVTPEHPGVGYARRTLASLSPGSLIDGWKVVAGHQAAGRLGGVTAPVTCLAGLQDPAAPLARVEALAAELPLSRLVPLQAPHMVQLECRDAFRQAVREHLAWVAAQ